MAGVTRMLCKLRENKKRTFGVRAMGDPMPQTVTSILPKRRHLVEVRLRSTNPEMGPIYLRHDGLQILGIVSGGIRSVG